MKDEILDEYSSTDDIEFIDDVSKDKMKNSDRTLRSKIEIRRELMELKKITGEYYDNNIFD